MKIMDPKDVKLDKCYLYGDLQGHPEAIVWTLTKHEGNLFWGRILTTESPGSHQLFFSYGSFIGPDKYHHFLRELTKAEVELAEEIVIQKLKAGFRGEDHLNRRLGRYGEITDFKKSIFVSLLPELTAGREVWAPATLRDKKD